LCANWQQLTPALVSNSAVEQNNVLKNDAESEQVSTFPATCREPYCNKLHREMVSLSPTYSWGETRNCLKCTCFRQRF